MDRDRKNRCGTGQECHCFRDKNVTSYRDTFLFYKCFQLFSKVEQPTQRISKLCKKQSNDVTNNMQIYDYVKIKQLLGLKSKKMGLIFKGYRDR